MRRWSRYQGPLGAGYETAGFRGIILDRVLDGPRELRWSLEVGWVFAGRFVKLSDAKARGEELLAIHDNGMAAGAKALGRPGLAASMSGDQDALPPADGIERRIWEAGRDRAKEIYA